MPPNSAPASRNVDAAAALKPVARKRRTSISGRSANQAWRTNSATSTAPTTIGTHAIGAVMPPCVSVSESPKTIPARPGDSSSSPVQSSRPASARPASGGRSFGAGPGPGEPDGGEAEGEEADRDVHEEDPAPRDRVDDEAADDRPEDRPEQRWHADDR